MVFNETILEMPARKLGIISEDLIVIVIPQLEIGLIKNLVVPDVAEQLQIIVAVEPLCDLT